MTDNHDYGHHTHNTKHESFHLDTVAVHLALLRTDKIIAFTGDDADIGNWNIGKSSLWDPANPNAKENPALARNLFCSGHCFLSDGRLLVAGGQSTVHPPFTFGILSFLASRNFLLRVLIMIFMCSILMHKLGIDMRICRKLGGTLHVLRYMMVEH